MKKGLLKGFLISAMVAQVFLAGPVTAADEPAKGHRQVPGTVERIQGDLISVKTREGSSRNFTLNESKREGFKTLKPGDEVVLEMDEGNQIVDIHLKGMASSGQDHGHRSITGTVEKFSRNDKTMTLRTKEGKSENFGLKDSALAKVGSIKEGVQITVEVDEQNRVMDLHTAGG